MDFTGAIHPLAAAFPLLPDDELAELAADITANGLIQPIVLDENGTLIDGRNRLAACRLAGIEPVYTVEPGDPIAFILSVNVRRRNITKGAQAMATALAYPEGRQGRREDIHGTSSLNEEVGSGYLSMARACLPYADLVDAVMHGGSLNQAYEIAQERKAADERDARRLTALRQRHPDLAARVDVGRSSLEQAEAAARELDRSAAVEALQAEVQLLREQIGNPQPWPHVPDMEVRLARTDDRAVALPPNPVSGEALDQEKRLLQRLIAIRDDVRRIAGEPLIEGAWWQDGQINAVRSAGGAIVEAVAQLVAAYNAMGEAGPLRAVK